MAKRSKKSNKLPINNKIHNQEKIQRVVIFIITLLLLFLAWHERRYIYRFQHLGYFGLFAFSVLSNATIFLPIPGFVSAFIAGSIWNPLIVGLVAGLGNAIGELVGYFLGFGGRGLVSKSDEGKYRLIKKLEKWFQKSGFLTIFISSALPIPFFDVVGIFAGTLNYPIYKFFLATALGRVIRNIIIAWSGAKIIP